MAMRMFSQAEFYAELQKHGFSRTHQSTTSNGTEIWLTPDGHPVTVSVHDQYPDYILDKYLLEVGRLYYLPLYDSNIRAADDD